jgi:hypothetical protein
VGIGLVYVVSALLGALLGGLISFAVAARSSRRDRRARYGESLLHTLSSAEQRLAAVYESDARGALREPVTLRDEAVAVWSRTELASSLESGSGRRAMQAWGEQLFEVLSLGAENHAQVGWLIQRLDLAVYITIAWTAGYASGSDFARPASEVAMMFGPSVHEDEKPDYGRRPT